MKTRASLKSASHITIAWWDKWHVVASGFGDGTVTSLPAYTRLRKARAAIEQSRSEAGMQTSRKHTKLPPKIQIFLCMAADESETYAMVLDGSTRCWREPYTRPALVIHQFQTAGS